MAASFVYLRCMFKMVTVALKLLTRVADNTSRPEKWPMLPSKLFMCIT